MYICVDRERERERYYVLKSHCRTKNDDREKQILKHMLVDIEFLAQFLLLSNASKLAELTHCHATLEIFDFMAQQAFYPGWIKGLDKIYYTLRRQINELSLAQQKALLASDQWQAQRAQVAAIWQNLATEITQ